jgi:hydrogenase maturation protein HypF
VAFDGTGYGTDGAIWGGEFLIAGYRDFERAYHLAYIPLPGGDASIRKPARTALAHILAAGLDLEGDLPPFDALQSSERAAAEHQARTGLNAPPTSSMGRLFDAVASIAGVRHEVNYDGQAAIELESLADPAEASSYGFEIRDGRCAGAGHPRGRQALGAASARRRFRPLSQRDREHDRRGMRAHPGGSWASSCGAERRCVQNMTLLGRTVEIRDRGFRGAHSPLRAPNDGGSRWGRPWCGALAGVAHMIGDM